MMVKIDDEREALAALFAVAALGGGHVNRLWDTSSTIPGNVIPAGYVVVPSDGSWHRHDVWLWLSADRLYGRSQLDVFGYYLRPGGRVHRGPETKTAPGTALDDAARGGDQAPTD